MDTYSVQLLKSMLGMDGFLAILSISNEAMERSKTLEQPSLIEILQSQSTVMFLELETLEDEDILTLVPCTPTWNIPWNDCRAYMCVYVCVWNVSPSSTCAGSWHGKCCCLVDWPTRG